jgi:hypothetical protein
LGKAVLLGPGPPTACALDRPMITGSDQEIRSGLAC